MYIEFSDGPDDRTAVKVQSSLFKIVILNAVEHSVTSNSSQIVQALLPKNNILLTL